MSIKTFEVYLEADTAKFISKLSDRVCMFPSPLQGRVSPFFEIDNERDHLIFQIDNERELMLSTVMHFLVKELMVDNANT